MRLTQKEQEKLMLHMAGNLAKERKERGVKLNYVESLAYISSELLELARDGKTVVELMQLGTKILTKKDVMDGVADMLEEVQVCLLYTSNDTGICIYIFVIRVFIRCICIFCCIQ